MRSTGSGLLTADNDFDLLQWCQYGFMNMAEVTYIVGLVSGSGTVYALLSLQLVTM